MPAAATGTVLQGSASAPPRSFTPEPPRVAARQVLRIQGYADPAAAPPAIREAADAMAREAEATCRPVVAWTSADILRHDGEALLVADGAGGVALHCGAFARTLAGCTRVVPFVLTLGAAMDERVVARAEAGDLLESLLLEAAGWLCIEDATRQFGAHLRTAAAREGRRLTSRLGPGYRYRIDGRLHDWALTEQEALFRLFAGHDLPVALLESCAMQPKLSRSGLYGLAPQATPPLSRSAP